VLELRRGGVPFPHGGPDGEWRYRHAVRFDGPTPLDAQAVRDFLTYETSHGRHVDVVADHDLGDWRSWPSEPARVAPREWPTQCCTHVYSEGCASPLVVHGATSETAQAILQVRSITPASHLGSRTGGQLAAASTWGEPADYFDYVMLANGRCTAPEAVARSKALGRDLVPADLDNGYPPAVRFYFAWDDLVTLPTATFDGVHPIKIAGPLGLPEHLVALAVHADQAAEILATDPSLRERIVVLTGRSLNPGEWATRADEAARAAY